MSVGLDRLMAALTHLGAVAPVKTTVQALVVSLGNVPAHEALRIANDLRSAGVRTEAYFGKKNRMKDQLSHADHYGIPVAVIIGEDELARGEVAVKDLRAGKSQRADIGDRDAYRQAGTATQVTVARAALVATVRRMLGGEAAP
jgi:histidyl-tRNA synthetase